MPTPVVFNGITYSIPLYNDTGYAQGFGNLSSYLIALAAGPSLFISTTSNPATAGTIRLAKTDTLDWRNNTNSANLPLGINGSDQLTFNGVVLATGSATSWGSIVGTLSNQTDLQSALNAKQDALSFGNLTDTGTDGITVTNGTGAIIGSGTSIAQHVADSSHSGYLSSTDWITFNGKQAALNTLTAHDVLVGSGTNVTLVSPSTAGFVLTSLGTSTDPSFQPSGIGNVGVLATSGSITPDASTANTFSCAVAGAVTLNGPSNGVDGQKVTFRIINDASHMVTLATGSGNFAFGTDITSYTNSTSLTDYIGAIWSTAASRWHVVALNQGF
jgi:hypothetical protein